MADDISEMGFAIFNWIVPSALTYDIGWNLGGKGEMFSDHRRDKSRSIKKRLDGKL